MKYEDFQADFEAAFLEGGVMGGALQSLFEQERSFNDWVAREYGRRFQITDPFFSFFRKTLVFANQQFMEAGITTGQEWYPRFLLWSCAYFKRMRAAEALFRLGYSLPACILLRDVRDWTMYVSAMSAGVVSFGQLVGTAGMTGDLTCAPKNVRNRIHHNRIKAEKTALDHTLRGQSGLRHKDKLELWEQYLNREVHGSEITVAIEGDLWIHSKGAFPLGPEKNHNTLRLFLSRSGEFGQLVLRIMPLLQLRPGSLGPVWAHKWDLLDRAFCCLNVSEGVEAPVYEEGFLELLEKKFGFTPQKSYFNIVG